MFCTSRYVSAIIVWSNILGTMTSREERGASSTLFWYYGFRWWLPQIHGKAACWKAVWLCLNVLKRYAEKARSGCEAHLYRKKDNLERVGLRWPKLGKQKRKKNKGQASDLKLSENSLNRYWTRRVTKFTVCALSWWAIIELREIPTDSWCLYSNTPLDWDLSAKNRKSREITRSWNTK